MKNELTIVIEQPTLCVNGITFDVRMSDADILTRSIALGDKYDGADITDAPTVQAVYADYWTFIDDVLGEGALEQIRKGKPIWVQQLQRIAIQIASAAAASYDEYVDEEYADPEAKPAEGPANA
jgi:hypothetical protein